ncbi:hypothetical protein I6N90_03360 [Paenibacillus sp. GSMTC-2017]|uniref:hypothetical protein n=1 Tax=Paenibacillus sp. GSMTC-2017 TaxID=2794350 RepID=UPI0018DA3440|nr:hypothetical protein [Paenibacillus sp. GSMTC-2017]MBH5316848.1 hypothetical protein [Paenibacillus sp. GSMTC-2017]
MKMEVKAFGIFSVFKTVLYFLILPAGFMAVLGLIALVVGFAIGEHTVTVMAIPYIIMPIFMMILYPVFGMLNGLIYNGFSKKFGGLEVTLVAKEQAQYQNQTQYQNQQQQQHVNSVSN